MMHCYSLFNSRHEMKETEQLESWDIYENMFLVDVSTMRRFITKNEVEKESFLHGLSVIQYEILDLQGNILKKTSHITLTTVIYVPFQCWGWGHIVNAFHSVIHFNGSSLNEIKFKAHEPSSAANHFIFNTNRFLGATNTDHIDKWLRFN